MIFIECDRKRKAERRRLPDDLFCNTCKSTFLTHFFRNSCFTKKQTCRLTPTYKFELGISWFSINHRNIDHHFSYKKVSCLKWVLRKGRYTENLLLKFVVRSNFIFASSCFGKRTCFTKLSSSCILYKKNLLLPLFLRTQILSTSVLFIAHNVCNRVLRLFRHKISRRSVPNH